MTGRSDREGQAKRLAFAQRGIGAVLALLSTVSILDAALAQTPKQSLPPNFWGGFLAGRKELAEQCPWPDDRQYAHTSDVFRKGRQPVDALEQVPGKVGGCAILRFHLDDNGNVTSSEVVVERPSGVGVYATTLLRATKFVPGGPHAVYMIRYGMHRSASGLWSTFQDIKGDNV